MTLPCANRTEKEWRKPPHQKTGAMRDALADRRAVKNRIAVLASWMGCSAEDFLQVRIWTASI